MFIIYVYDFKNQIKNQLNLDLIIDLMKK